MEEKGVGLKNAARKCDVIIDILLFLTILRNYQQSIHIHVHGYPINTLIFNVCLYGRYKCVYEY